MKLHNIDILKIIQLGYLLEFLKQLIVGFHNNLKLLH